MSSPLVPNPVPPAPFALPNSYYLRLVTSEYQGPAPNMLTWLNDNLQYLEDVTAALLEILNAYYLPAAVGAQLDVIGVIVGQTRLVGFQPTGLNSVAPGGGTTTGSAGTGYIVGDIVTVIQTGAQNGTLRVTAIGSGGSVSTIQIVNPGNGYSALGGPSVPTSGGHGTGFTCVIVSTISPILDDNTYRQVLQCRVFQNHWDGQIGSLGPFWQTVFPGGTITLLDHMNMTATVTVGGDFSSILIDLILNGYIVPRPQAVLYTYALATTTLPVFGFDESTPYVAGFDLGHFL
jgi:hypothetical protein